MNDSTLIQARQQAALCGLLGNPMRLLILWSLVDGELSVNEIASRVGSSLQNVSQHLHLLSSRKLLGSRREGQHIYYRLSESAWLSKCLAMADAIGEGCACSETTEPKENEELNNTADHILSNGG